MTLIINNDDVAKVLTMELTIAALEESYARLATREAVCRPRIDIEIPTSDPTKTYRWGTMEGGSTAGYFAIRMKSDVVFQEERGGAVTHEKYCMKPGLYCGLILLTSIETGEPLAIINDGVLQHMRVGADGAIGVKHMARGDAAVVGMLGSGGMARSHVEAFLCVRRLKRLQVYSPTKSHRDSFAREMSERHAIEAKACDTPDEVYRGADIVAALTDSAVPVLDGKRLEPGTHVVNVGGGGKPGADTLARIARSLRFGSAPPPIGFPELALGDQHLTFAARPDPTAASTVKRSDERGRGRAAPEMVTLEEVLNGKPGRTSPDQITYSERGSIQGAQFYAVAGKVYELARREGLGHEVPTSWFLQDIRD